MDLSWRHVYASANGVGMSHMWDAVALMSLLWLVYRILLVYRKPTEELEEILGIDIPPVPEVTLSSIAPESVLLYWKAPDNYYSSLTIAVQVNGISGSHTRSDATIKVTRLQPGHCYGIRLVTTNSAGNPSYSSVIQVQTPPLGGHESSKLLSSFDGTHGKRPGGRRISQPLLGNEKSPSPGGQNRAAQQDDSQKRLQRELDNLRRDVEEANVQLKEDREGAEQQMEHWTGQRDTLKRQVEEREKGSQELKKKVNELEKQCKISQRKKSERERRVQQKRTERQKMEDDMARWETEEVKIREDLEGTKQSKTELEETHERELQEAQERYEQVHVDTAKLEEELREMGIKVRKLEGERERADREQNDEERQIELREREENDAHEAKINEHQQQYYALWKLNADATAALQEVNEQLVHLMELKKRDPSSFVPIPYLDYRPDAFQNRRQVRGGLSMNRPNHPTYSNSVNPSPTFAHAYPFEPMGPKLRSGNHTQLSPADTEMLLAGAPMSPSADVLLPLGLLSEEEDQTMASQRAMRMRGGSIPHIYRPPSLEAGGNVNDPQSPRSIDSKSPSLFSSPHESLANIHSVYGPDDDTQSLGSASSPFSATAPASTPGSSRKISSLLWGFNRQRDKAPLSELPALGSLNSKESQSFPSNLEQSPDQPTSGGRKGAGIWSPMTGLGFLNRGSGKQPENDVLASGPMRKGRRGILGSKLDSPDPLMSSSSRPSSTYSYDQIIGQPVIEGQYGWKTPDSTRPRGSTLAGPWSHSQSRRTSVQHGSTSNLSLGSTPLDADDYPSPYNFRAKATPAPIGTERFRIGQRSITPKLNPAAPTFTTRFFSRGGDSKKPKAEKSTEFGSDKGKAVEKSRDLDAYSKSSSPPVSRLSHDAPSFDTSASIGESHDSLEPTTSATHSEAGGSLPPPSSTSGSAPKESLMQRITRKSSSSKFSVPWVKDRGGKGAARKEPSTPGDLDEEFDSDYLGRGVASEATSTPPPPPAPPPGGRASLSWSRVMGTRKKRSGLDMSDAGERSSEAGGETEDDG